MNVLRLFRFAIPRLVALLLLTASALKAWQLLTEPMVEADLWSSRPFVILQVEFELALAIWLASGVFRKAAWLTTFLCFCLFSLVTFYKGISGAASCGCFGPVHVNPWITLLVIDLPVVFALSFCKPTGAKPPARVSRRRLVFVASLYIVLLGLTVSILAFNRPPKVTSSYEILEPRTWSGKRLPILEYIDIGEKLQKGNWLILLYHHDCPSCAKAIHKYEQISRLAARREDFPQIAFVEVPPYSPSPASQNGPCTLGRLSDAKQWFVSTPTVVLLKTGRVVNAWEARAPDPAEVMAIYEKS